MKNQNPFKTNEQPLLQALTAEALRRGDSLTDLAVSIGVTYRRLAQWRSGEASIARASNNVLLACARYLGVPGVLVLMLAGQVSIELLLAPSPDGDKERLDREMRKLLNESRFAGIAPKELLHASPKVQLFVSYLASEADGQAKRLNVAWTWLQGLSGDKAVRADPNLSHRADPILSQGW